ncbi:MAG: DNA translocase FtsK [Clostridia bacterium]|nr:DNA translocase FtsK [Clostridia bacterium]
MNRRQIDSKRSKKSGSGDLIGIALIVVSAFFLLCICVPIILGAISQAIRVAVLGVFGLFAYPMFLAFLFLGISLVRDLSLRISVKSRICISVIAFCAMIILQLATSFSHLNEGFSYYISSVLDVKVTAGGVLFGIFAYGLQAAVTQVFAYILMSTGIIIPLLIMLNVFGKIGGKKEKQEPVPQNKRATFEKSDKPAKMVRPIEDNGLFVGTIIPNPNKIGTDGGSFSQMSVRQPTEPSMDSRLTENDARNVLAKSKTETPRFESYESVREKYGVESPKSNGLIVGSKSNGYSGSSVKRDPREVLFGNKTAQYRNYIAANTDPAVLNSAGYGGLANSSDYGVTEYNATNVITPTPSVSVPQVKTQPMPPKYVHKPIAGYEVVMPAPKDISADIVGGEITDGEAESQKLAETKRVVETESENNGFNRKRIEPTTFKPIERTQGNEEVQAPIVNGDYFRKENTVDKTLDTSKNSEKLIVVSNDETYKTKTSERVYDDIPKLVIPEPKLENPIENDEPLAPIIDGESNEPLTSLEELIKSEKRIMGRDEAAETKNDVRSDFAYTHAIFETEYEPDKEAAIVREDKKQSGFEYSDEVEDLSEKTFAPIDDNTGYYESDSLVVETPKAPPIRNRASTSTQKEQVSIDAFLASNKPDEQVKPKPRKKHVKYIAPPLDLLVSNSVDPTVFRGNAEEKSKKLEETLESLRLPAKVIAITSGPAVTRYELEIPPGISVRKIENFSSDIQYNLESDGKIRIETPIPGKRAVGIEVPNSEIATVALRDIIGSKEFQNASSPLTLAVGKDIAGANIICNLEKMPHLLIAGATGSGKSACLNSIIASILYKASPEDVRLILIDPKEVEFRIYRDMPHLLMKEIINETDQAIRAFKWAKLEMDRRYKLLSQYCTRNIQEFNACSAVKDGIEEKMPRIVIVVDELCELMMSGNRKDMEDKIMSMAQKARAAGIHLILATQRPSVDVITGTIKANLPSRIAFAVASFNDSRTILDQGGAESLLGRGDMLYSPADMPQPKRVQGAFITSEEVASIVEFVKAHNAVDYDSAAEELIMTEETPVAESGASASDGDDEFDPLIKDVLRRVIETGQASTSMVQRRFSVGYARASRIVDQMESNHFIGPMEGANKPREVFITAEQFREMFGEDL